VVIVTNNELQGLMTLLFSIEFSDYGATVVSKLSLCSTAVKFRIYRSV